MMHASFFRAPAVTLKNLESEADWKCEDQLGPDPFKLRSHSLKNTPILSFVEVLQKNLWGPFDLSLPVIYTDIPHHVPNIVHFIWLGNRDLPAQAQENILSWQHYNTDKVIVIWTNQTNFLGEKIPDEVLEKRLMWCKAQHILLLPVEAILDKMINRVPFIREMLMPNYGSAADILKVEILRFFGGISSDIDIACIKILGTMITKAGIKINVAERQITDKFKLCAINDTNLIFNDLIMALPDADKIKNIIEAIQHNYQKDFAELFKQGLISERSGKKLYYQQCLDIPPSLLFRDQTIIRTGPAVFAHLFGGIEYKVRHNFGKEIIIDPANFEFQSGRTWLDKESMQGIDLTRENAVKRILSCILVDLHIEDKTVLILEKYADSIRQHQIATVLMEMLAKYYPQLAKKIKFIRFDNCLSHHEVLDFFNTILQQKYYPSMTQDPAYYARYYQYFEGMLAAGMDLSHANLLTHMQDCRDKNLLQRAIQYYIKENFSLAEIFNLALTTRYYQGKNDVLMAALLESNPMLWNEAAAIDPIHWACEHCNSLETFKVMMHYGETQHCSLDKINSVGKSPLVVLTDRQKHWHWHEEKRLLVDQLIKHYQEVIANTQNFKEFHSQSRLTNL